MIIQQHATCFNKGASEGCRLPFIEVSLGQVLALASSLLMVGLFIGFWGYYQLQVIFAGFTIALAGSLLIMGSANGLLSSQSLGQQLATARVGLYHITLQSTDDKLYISQAGSKLWTLYYKSTPVLRKPNACYTWNTSIYVCYQTIRDLSLRAALLGVLGLAVVAILIAWKTQRFRKALYS